MLRHSNQLIASAVSAPKALLLVLGLALFTVAVGSLKPLSNDEMQAVNGQAGLTINGDLVTQPFSTTLVNAARTGETKFLSISNTQLNITLKDLKLDADGAVTDNFGSTPQPGVVMTLPERIEFGTAANPTQLGSVQVSWTDDGSAPASGDTVQVPREYIIRKGVVNDPGDHVSTGDAISETYNQYPMLYRVNHDQTGIVELTGFSNNDSTYDSGTGDWGTTAEWSFGNNEYARMIVDTQATVNINLYSNDDPNYAVNPNEANNNGNDPFWCDPGSEGGGNCYHYPDGYFELVDTQTLQPMGGRVDNLDNPNTNTRSSINEGCDYDGWTTDPECTGNRTEQETASYLLGNAPTQKVNRNIGTVSLYGGFNVGGRVKIIPQ